MTMSEHLPSGPNFEEENDVAVAEKLKAEVKIPPKYKVLLHNDDYTTMEFVIFVLTSIFYHSETQAMRVMLAVHEKGVGVAGVFSYDVAETKVEQVHQLARANEFPLKASLEAE